MTKPNKIKKEKIDDGFDFDDDLDMGELDFDFDAPKKDRSPVTDFKEGVVEGLKTGPRDGTFIKETMKEILPPGYGQTIDFASNMAGRISATYEQTLREIKPEVKLIKKALSKTIPEDAWYVPKVVQDKIKQWKQDDDYESRQQSSGNESNQREEYLSSTLTGIFQAQLHQDQAAHDRQSTQEALTQGLDMRKHRDTMTVLSDAAASMARLDQYNRSINLEFQKKSLEVSYRQLFGIQDIVKVAQATFDLQSQLLPAIQKNTALPDYVKLQSSEFLMEYNKRRMASLLGNGLFGNGAQYFSKAITGVGEKIKGKVKEGASSLADMATQLQDVKEMADSAGLSAAGMAGDQLGSSISRGIAGSAAKSLVDDKLATNKSFVRLGLRGLNLVENAGQLADRFRKDNVGNYESGIGNFIKRNIAELMPSAGTQREVSDSSTTPGSAFSAGPNGEVSRTEKSLTEIIPGYLARILQELQITRSGDTSTGLTTFDMDRSEFVSKSEMTKRVMGKVYDQRSADQLHKSFDETFTKLKESGYDLSDEAKASLRQRMMTNASEGTYADERTLGDASVYENKAGAEEAAKAMREFFEKAAVQKQLEFRRSHNRLASDLKNTAPDIQRLVDQGHSDILRQQGILSSEVSSYDGSLSNGIDMKKMLDHYLNMAPSGASAEPEVKKPTMADELKKAMGESETIQKAQQAYKKAKEDLRARGKKVKKGAFAQARKMAKSMGATGLDKALDENAETKPSDILRAAMEDASNSKSGQAAKAKLDQASKAIEKEVSGNVHLSALVDAGKEAAAKVEAKIKNVNSQAESMLERCTVDGEIDYELLLKELAALPEKIRVAVMQRIIKIKEGFLEAWKEIKEAGEDKEEKKEKEPAPAQTPTPPTPASEAQNIKQEQSVPSVDKTGDTPAADLGKQDDPNTKKFAKGGVFINKILDKTTKFKLWAKGGVQDAVAGEDGKEAVMPIGDGGVQLLNHDGSRKSLLPVVRAPDDRLSVIMDRGQGLSRFDNSSAEDIDYKPVSKVTEQASQSPYESLKGKLKIDPQSISTLVDKATESVTYAADAFKFFSTEGWKAVKSKAANVQVPGLDTIKTKFGALGSDSDRGQAVQTGLPGEGIPKQLNDINETLNKILDRVEHVAVAGLGGKPNLSMANRSLIWAKDKTIGGISGLIKGTSSLFTGSAKLSGKLLSSTWDVTKAVAKIPGKFKGRTRDVYVKGEQKPRLYGVQIDAGKYTRMQSKDVLRSHKDVNQAIQDENGNILIKDDELDQLVCPDPRGIMVRLASAVGSGLAYIPKKIVKGAGWLATGGMAAMWNLEMTILKGAMRSAKGALRAGYNFLGKPVDLYTPGVKDPVLLANLMVKGYYVSKNTGKAIYSYSDIDGPVLDGDGNEVVTLEMLQKGLYDNKGRAVRTRLGKWMRFGVDMALGAGKLVAKTFKASWEATKKIATAGMKGIGAVGKLVTGGLGGVFGGSDAITSKKSLSVLEEIRTILDDRLPESDIVPGVNPTATAGDTKPSTPKRSSLRDIFKRNQKQSALKQQEDTKEIETAKEAVKAKLQKKDPAEKDSGGLLGKLGDLVDGIKNLFSLGKGSIGKLMGWGASALGLGGAATAATAGTTVAAGTAAATTATAVGAASATGVAATGATAAAGAAAGSGILASVGGGLVTLGSALGALLGSPVVIGAAVTAAAGYGAWKIYRHYKDKLSDIDKLRLVQYGYHPDDEKGYAKIVRFERTLQDRVQFTNEGPDILEGKINLKDTMAIFDLDSEDKADVNRFTMWYRARFKPVFLTHALAIKHITGKFDIDAISSLEGEQLLSYMGMASFMDGPYSVTQLPMHDAAYKACSSADVKAVIQNIRLKYKLDEIKSQPGKPGVAANKTSREQRGIQLVADGQKKQQEELAKAMPELPKTNFSLEVEKPPTATSSMGPSNSKINPTGLKYADGPLLDGRNGYNLIRQDGKLKMEQVNPALMKSFFGAVEEYHQLTGKRITVTDAYRSYEDQVAMRQKFGTRAAVPGTSLHGFGLALDADSKALNEMDDLGLLRKYGLTRPVGGEPWHLEPIGVQLDIDRYRQQPELASKAIEEGVGRGGGGLGTQKDATEGSRNLELTRQILTANIQPNVKLSGIDSNAKPMGAVSAMDTRRTTAKPNAVGMVGPAVQPGKAPLQASNQPKFAPLPDMESKPAVVAADAPNKSHFGALPDKPQVGALTKIPEPKGRDKQSVKETITAAAQVVGIDPKIALTTAAVESGLNPDAKAKLGSAAGLNGFTQDTWKETVGKYGAKYGYTPQTTSVFDARANALMGAHYIKANGDGQTQDVTRTYMSHFLGKSGAKRLYDVYESAPETSAAQVLPKAAAANESIFYDNGAARSVRALVEFIAAKLKKTAASFGIDLGGDVQGPAPAQTKTVQNTPQDSSWKALKASTSAQKPQGDTDVAKSTPKPSRASIKPEFASMSLGVDMSNLKPSRVEVPMDNSPGANLMFKTEGILSESLAVQKRMEQLLAVIANKDTSTPAARQVETKVSAPTQVASSTPETTKPSTRASSARYGIPELPVSMRRRA